MISCGVRLSRCAICIRALCCSVHVQIQGCFSQQFISHTVIYNHSIYYTLHCVYCHGHITVNKSTNVKNLSTSILCLTRNSGIIHVNNPAKFITLLDSVFITANGSWKNTNFKFLSDEWAFQGLLKCRLSPWKSSQLKSHENSRPVIISISDIPPLWRLTAQCKISKPLDNWGMIHWQTR